METPICFVVQGVLDFYCVYPSGALAPFAVWVGCSGLSGLRPARDGLYEVHLIGSFLLLLSLFLFIYFSFSSLSFLERVSRSFRVLVFFCGGDEALVFEYNLFEDYVLG